MQKKYNAIRKELGIPVRQAFDEAHKAGMSLRNFAQSIGLGETTLRRWLRRIGYPRITHDKRNYSTGNYYNGVSLNDRAKKLGYKSLFHMAYEYRENKITFDKLAERLGCKQSSISRALTKSERLSLPYPNTQKMYEHRVKLCKNNHQKQVKQRELERQNNPHYK